MDYEDIRLKQEEKRRKAAQKEDEDRLEILALADDFRTRRAMKEQIEQAEKDIGEIFK